MTIAAFFVANWFGPALNGQLGILLAGVQLVTMMGDGSAAAIIQFISRESSAESELAAKQATIGWTLSWLSLLMSVGLSVVLWVILLLDKDSGTPLFWITLAAFLAVARTGRTAFDASYRAMGNFTIPAVAGIVCTAGMAGCILYFCGQGYRIGAYLGFMSLFTVFNIVWQVLAFRQKRVGKLLPDMSMFLEFFRFVYPLAVRGLAGFLFLKINIWIIDWVASDAQAGQFRLADQFLTIPFLLISAILTAVAPRVARAQAEGHSQLCALVEKVYGLMLMLAVPVALFFIWNGLAIKPLFPEYGPASDILQLFTPAMVFMCFGYAASIFIVQGGYPKVAFWLTFIPGLVNVVFAYVGFRISGLMGLVAGTVIVHTGTYIVTVIVAHRLLKLPYRVSFH